MQFEGEKEMNRARGMTRRSLAGSAAAGVALVACGFGGAQQTAGANTAFTRDATVRYMTNSDPASLAGTQEIVTLFAPLQPKIKVELEPTGFNEIPTKLTAAAAAGTPPDCSQCSFPGMVGLAAKGALQPLEAYTKKDAAFDFADIFPAYVEASKYKGGLFAISIEGGPFVAFFNDNLFKGRRASCPKPSRTAGATGPPSSSRPNGSLASAPPPPRRSPAPPPPARWPRAFSSARSRATTGTG